MSVEAQLAAPPMAVQKTSTDQRKFWLDLALALSIANFCFIQAWFGLLFDTDFGYFNRVPVNRLSVAALLLNLLWLTAALFFMGRWVRRRNQRWLWWVASIAPCASLLVPLNFARITYFAIVGSKVRHTFGHPLAVAGICATLIAGLIFLRWAAKAVRGLYLLLFPMIFFVCGKSVLWLLAPPLAPQEPRAASVQTKPSVPRIVWIIFDELDQRIAFEQRPSDIAMPELTRFCDQCFHATNAFPPGGATLYSMPALLSGQMVYDAKPVSASDLSIVTFDSEKRGSWAAQPSVFQAAKQRGANTALVGWYHPYSRILQTNLDYCEWFPYPPFEQARGKTFGESMLNQLCATISFLQQRRLQIQIFEGSLAASLALVGDPKWNVILLHLPVPHHPGIYDPKHQKLTLRNLTRFRGYLNNLPLADEVFRELRNKMEAVGLWDQEWVLVSSDHWWREAEQFDGKQDHRVPFMLKAPRSNQSITYGNRFNTVLTKDLILAVLDRELTESAQLAPWLDAHSTPPPEGYDLQGKPKRATGKTSESRLAGFHGRMAD